MKEKGSFWYSKISSSQTCLQKYKYQYLDEIEPEGKHSAALEFGTAVHLGLEAVLEGGNGVYTFQAYWDSVRDKDIHWGRMDWGMHYNMGSTMIERFVRLHLPHLQPILFEERIYAELDGIKFEGTPDVYGQYKGALSIIDFKTSASRYMNYKIDIAQQLVAYAWLMQQNGYPLPKQLVYFVFVKSTLKGQSNPSIQVLTKPLTPQLVSDTMKNITIIAHELITRSEFPKNYGACLNYNSPCQFWDYCHNGKKVPINDKTREAESKDTPRTDQE